MNSDVEKISYNGHTIHIRIDEFAESPRNMDNLGKMVCFNRNDKIGDDHNFKSSMFDGWKEFKEHLERECDAFLVLPLYLLDHSGLSMRCWDYSDIDYGGWDSRQVGFIYATKDDVNREFGNLSEKAIEYTRNVLLKEVETYDSWLQGNVYGYIIDDGRDSCWGYYDVDDAIEDAKISIAEINAHLTHDDNRQSMHCNKFYNKKLNIYIDIYAKNEYDSISKLKGIVCNTNDWDCINLNERVDSE